MVCTLHPVLFFVLMAVQATGLLSVFLCRATVGTRWHGWSHAFFLATLGLVGASTIISLGHHSSYWLVSGFTLGAMVVGATCDFQRENRTVAG